MYWRNPSPPLQGDGAVRNLRLTLEYEGTGYHGWQAQPGLVTIQQVIEDRLERILRESVTLIGAGRTDAGVHAREQVANFRCSSSLPLPNLHRGLNSLLPDDIAAVGMAEAPPEFNSRYWALSKLYVYRILNRPCPSPHRRLYSWRISRPLEVEAMREALSCVTGEHDFSAFRASGCTARSVVRTVYRAELIRSGDCVEILLEANAFLRYMVRNIVGTLVQVGEGKRKPEEMAAVLSGRDRRLAGPTAPARGLTLEKVFLKPSDSLALSGEAT